MKNNDIRKLIENSNMKYWEVAYKLGMTDATFSKKLRFELSKDLKQRIKNIENPHKYRLFRCLFYESRNRWANMLQKYYDMWPNFTGRHVVCWSI